MRPGSTNSTVSRLNATPLASTTPMSRPMAKLMATRHSMPAIVVSELEAMAVKPPRRARTMARDGSASTARSWR